MKLSWRIMLALSYVGVLALLAGCGGAAGGPTEEGPPKQSSAFELDESAAVERSITTTGGGGVAIKPTKDSIARVIFPKDSLKQDATVVVTPLKASPVDDDNIVAAGFMVSDASGAALELASPALITFTVSGKLPDGATLVRYSDDGKTYEPVESEVNATDKASVVSAVVSGFSAYGISNGEGGGAGAGGSGSSGGATDNSSGGSNDNPTMADFNWVVYVNDSFTFEGEMTQIMKLDLRAQNTKGRIAGPYKGKATATTTGRAEVAGGVVTNKASAKSTSLNFTLVPYVEDPLAPLVDESQPDPLAPLVPSDDDALAPLVPDDDGALAPLVPDKKGPPKPPKNGADYQGEGSITMSASGTVTGQVGGVSGSGSYGNDATLPITLFVSGPQVYLYVDFPEVGRAVYRGYIIGEGKK